MTAPTKPVAVYPSIRLAKIDGRRKESRILRETREALIAHVGGNPTAAALGVINRIAWLSLRAAQLDARIIAGEFSEYDSKVYLAVCNSITRMLKRDLGLKGADAAPPSLADVLRDGDAA
jgi:hypothetical protein